MKVQCFKKSSARPMCERNFFEDRIEELLGGKIIPCIRFMEKNDSLLVMSRAITNSRQILYSDKHRFNLSVAESGHI